MSKKETTIDDLAVMVGKGFGGMQREMSKGFNDLSERVTKLEDKFDDFREQNEREHLELKLRQDNVAYRFELESLDKRVSHLEKKVKLA